MIKAPMSSTRTDWPKCDKCNRKVTTKSGVLVSFYEGYGSMTLDMVGHGPWQWGHIRCLNQLGYAISADTFATEDDAMEWAEWLLTYHSWFYKTNWRETWKRFYDITLERWASVPHFVPEDKR